MYIITTRPNGEEIYGDKRFDKTASTFWNNLPSETRYEQSLEIFKKYAKTYL